MRFYFSVKKWAGLFGFSVGDYSCHFLVSPRFWVWGCDTMEGATEAEWGLGPLFLLCRFDGKT